MDFSNDTTMKAVVTVGDQRVPVLVDLSEVINIRDRRRKLEGQLWSTEMPSTVSTGAVLKLFLPDSWSETIYLESVRPCARSSGGESQLYFYAEFLSARCVEGGEGSAD